MKPVRVLLAKPGLDGHDRGVKVVAMALRDAGAEVIYLGPRRTPSQILDSAVDEDVDVIGLSILSGAHLTLTRQVLEQRTERGVDTPVIVGGTIPTHDARTLHDWGVEAVFATDADLDALVASVLGIGADRAALDE